MPNQKFIPVTHVSDSVTEIAYEISITTKSVILSLPHRRSPPLRSGGGLGRGQTRVLIIAYELRSNAAHGVPPSAPHFSRHGTAAASPSADRHSPDQQRTRTASSIPTLHLVFAIECMGQKDAAETL